VTSGEELAEADQSEGRYNQRAPAESREVESWWER